MEVINFTSGALKVFCFFRSLLSSSDKEKQVDIFKQLPGTLSESVRNMKR